MPRGDANARGVRTPGPGRHSRLEAPSGILPPSDRCESNSAMTEQRQSFGPGRVLAEVSLIVALPIVGGVIAGLVADNVLGTSPLLVLGGLLLGSLITASVLYRYITANAARLRGTGRAGDGSAAGQRPDGTAGNNSTDDA